MEPIVVINPNSTVEVTRGIDAALAPLRLDAGPPIETITLSQGPPGIETERHIAQVVDPICALVAGREETASAFVIACFSDPGLHATRALTRRPVFGIAEAAMTSALTLGERFGIVSILETSIPRHARAVRAAGLTARFAGDVAIGVPVTELADEATVAGRLRDVGHRLKDEHRADVLVLGCAGMARYRKSLSAELGIPVIDPTLAAVTLALGAVLLDPD